MYWIQAGRQTESRCKINRSSIKQSEHLHNSAVRNGVDLMKVAKRIHRIKISFNITPEIERFVYMYIIEGKKLYLIDAGVDGAEKLLSYYLSSIGKDIKDIEAVFLTHSHPDHIGGASEIKRLSGCKVYACQAESEWIENIDKQFLERPIPNFYNLLNKSVAIDSFVKDGDLVKLEDGITIKVIDSRGHSQESLSYYLVQDKALFSGDAIPLSSDIPIYVSAKQSMATLEKFLTIKNVDLYLSAWDKEKNTESGIKAINEGLEHLKMIDKEIRSLCSENADATEEKLFDLACERLNMKRFNINPLFRRSIMSNVYKT